MLGGGNRSAEPPPSLPGFEQINRYWDPQHGVFAAKLLPGEFYVTRGGEMVVTTLGSCVSACVRDRRLAVGGMNHFMLPLRGGVTRIDDPLSESARYGNYAMEQLINRIMALGGKRSDLEVKLFGGGRVLDAVTDVGKRNIEFAREYIATEGLRLLSEDLGGDYPRKVQYFPESGRARSKKLYTTRNNTVVRREEHYLHEIDESPKAGDIDLF
ncbi:chemoreceptor glutamine deamidase CheD [Halorhodospira halochloris]|uniref:chemoreceptor glutamine deamidase CheD n=1 Tax=Halorhodospira halochloris TaxID=1052 RepID=UPI001EE98829|nr:chemoreceptor glutamine deamidase CheD [Halorhodospira halochloris]MCG5547458.1 chemoreceptor glutamine deamidase CheD [Halorhodospira halochloris]